MNDMPYPESTGRAPALALVLAAMLAPPALAQGTAGLTAARCEAAPSQCPAIARDYVARIDCPAGAARDIASLAVLVAELEEIRGPLAPDERIWLSDAVLVVAECVAQADTDLSNRIESAAAAIGAPPGQAAPVAVQSPIITGATGVDGAILGRSAFAAVEVLGVSSQASVD